MQKKGVPIDVTEKYIRWFSELGKKDVSLAGGKGANLGEMYNSGFPVPPGFAIIANAYKYFLEETNLDKELYDLLSKTNIEDTKQLDEVSKIIKKKIQEAQMPEDLEKEIIENYELLGFDKQSYQNVTPTAMAILEKAKDTIFVAVRSSATAEDTAAASFAGQNETFLNIKGSNNIIQAVKNCFASLFTPRSIYYRIKKGFKHEEVLIAVIVQAMVNSDKSGIIFSRDPMKTSENPDIVIESVYGLGEGIVSGRISPDHYVVSRDLEIKSKTIADKKIAIVRNSAGENTVVKLTEERSKSQVLTDYEIKRYADFAIKLEEHYKKPQDIEFAIDTGNLYLVQTRPITTLKKEQKIEEVEGKIIVEGQPASPGIGSGEVKIIYEMSDLEKIKKGDVLVTKMTNPDMVVAMQKSAAIVTDEGGATCFSGETKVLTNKGLMQIKEAHDLITNKEDLALLSYDSKEMAPKWKKIINAGKRKSKMVRISVSQTGRIDDNTVDLTPDHKMITFDKRELIKEKIEDILQNKKMLCLLDSMPNLQKINEEKKAYLLGALLSDGYHEVNYYHTGNPRRGRIVFTQKETEEKKQFIETVKEYYKEIFNEEFNNKVIITTNSQINGRQVSGYATHFISRKLEPALEVSRIFKNLDLWMLSLDVPSSINFLAGLIDGDGCFKNNRIHVYIAKENILQGVILACLNIGIFPQVTKNRNIYHIQILEKMQEILNCTNRVKGTIYEKINGNKLFSAKQILGDIIDNINLEGKIKPYIKSNLLIDSRKIRRFIQLCSEQDKEKLKRIITSGLRMQRVKKIIELNEDEVYNLEVEADNELDHNFFVFTKKYTPLLVSNSHAAIVSREMGIPAVIGTQTATSVLKDGMIITVDGYKGKVYEGKLESLKAEKAKVEPIVPTQTKIKVIVDLPHFAARAALTKATFIGLTRLEGIIAESGKHPFYFVHQKKINDYEKLIYEGLKAISEHFEGLWIRTSDIRSDEYRHLEGAPSEVELNPMLGMHGIRAGLKYPDILKAELRAAVKLAESKKVGLMMPQVILVEEIAQVKKMLEEIGIPKNLQIGVMIETPAAVQIIEELCMQGIEFISFGTNDLTQFTLAIDRGNEHVQYLYNETDPSVLKQIAHVIQVCKRYKVETSICGQAGSDKKMVEFLVKQGIDSISVNADKAKEISEFVKEMEDKGLRATESGLKQASIENMLHKAIEKEKKAEKENKEVKGDADIELGIDVFTPQVKDSKQDKVQNISSNNLNEKQQEILHKLESAIRKAKQDFGKNKAEKENPEGLIAFDKLSAKMPESKPEENPELIQKQQQMQQAAQVEEKIKNNQEKIINESIDIGLAHLEEIHKAVTEKSPTEKMLEEALAGMQQKARKKQGNENVLDIF